MVCEETNSNPAADECMPRLEQLKWWEGWKRRGLGEGREEQSHHWNFKRRPEALVLSAPPHSKWINPKKASFVALDGAGYPVR